MKVIKQEEKYFAKEHGFLPEESDIVDYRFAQGSRKLEKLAEILRKTDTENTGKDELVRIQKEITSILKLLGEEKSTFSKLTRDNFLLEEVWLNLDGSNWEDLLNQKRYTDESPINMRISPIRKQKEIRAINTHVELKYFLIHQRMETIYFGCIQMTHLS